MGSHYMIPLVWQYLLKTLQGEQDMPKNQVQFQKGLSLSIFLDTYGTDEKHQIKLFQARWSQGYSPSFARICVCTFTWHYLVRVTGPANKR